MPLHKKDFFGLRGMSADDIRYILGTAETMKYILNQKDKKTPHLQGKSVIMRFYEQSARAKLAYELAAQYLGQEIAIAARRLQKTGFDALGFLFDHVEHRVDFALVRKDLSVVLNPLARLYLLSHSFTSSLYDISYSSVAERTSV